MYVSSHRVTVGMFQLLSVLENTLSKLARYDQSSVFSSILTLTVSTPRHISKTTRPKFTKFCACCLKPTSRGLVLVWRRCDTRYALPVLWMT